MADEEEECKVSPGLDILKSVQVVIFLSIAEGREQCRSLIAHVSIINMTLIRRKELDEIMMRLGIR